MPDTQGAREAPDTVAPPVDILTPADIQNAVRVIDFAADQGAFKGWEVIQQVLLVRNRLNNFLIAVMPKPDETSAEADAAAAAA